MPQRVNLALCFQIEKPFKNSLETFDSRHAGIAIGLCKTAPLNLGQSGFKRGAAVGQIEKPLAPVLGAGLLHDMIRIDKS